MKKQLLSIVSIAFIALFAACGGQEPVEDVKPALTVDQLEIATTLVVQIDGMACPNGCARPIQDNCAKLTGVAESRVDFASGKGYFTFDAAKLSEKDIIACIEGTNGGDHYKVVSIEGENSTVEPAEDETTEEPGVTL
ncbi:MAG: cation transporter [Flavobacteriales bacterium]|nr:cation transporter [Flavobacteriales bacterium]